MACCLASAKPLSEPMLDRITCGCAAQYNNPAAVLIYFNAGIVLI